MKKRIALLLALLQLCLVFTACAEKLHEHDFVLTQDVAATCTEEGYKSYICECGERKIDKFPAIGHDFKVEKETEPTCEDSGGVVEVCGNCGEERQTTVDPIGHNYSGDPDDYVGFHVCENCGDRMLLVSDKPFEKEFKTGFTSALKEDVRKTIDDLNAFLDAGEGTEEEFKKLFSSLKLAQARLEQAVGRTQLMSFVDTNLTSDYNNANKFYQDTQLERRALYVRCYESKYRDAAYPDWDADELKEYIDSCKELTDPEIAELTARSDEISQSVLQLGMGNKEIPGLLKELKDINNKIAKRSGYSNYYEYAFEAIYGRAYGPKETDVFAEYLETYIYPFYNEMAERSRALAEILNDPEINELNTALKKTDLFRNADARDALSYHLSRMNVEGGPDMYAVINDLFKNGNYFFGASATAFTLEDIEIPLLYFKHDAYYSGLFTVVHEFGHYTNAIHNPGYALDFDLAETHSQGNVALLLYSLHDWLMNRAKDDAQKEKYEKYFEYLEATYVSETLQTVITAELVDYFELLLYTGKVNTDDYAAFIKENLPSHANVNYILTVATYQPCYYISYSVSALPSIMIYAIAREKGFDAAKEAYFKLMTYFDTLDDPFEWDGIIYTDATYEDVLDYADIPYPFEEDFYTALLGAFDFAIVD